MHSQHPSHTHYAASTASASGSKVKQTSAKRNVGQLEGTICLFLGAIFIFRALLPRSITQALGLLIGGELLYRGISNYCPVYDSLGIDTTKHTLVSEVKEKVLD